MIIMIPLLKKMISKYLMTIKKMITARPTELMRKKPFLINLETNPKAILEVQLSQAKKCVIVKIVLFLEVATNMLLQKEETSILETLLKIMRSHAFLVTRKIIISNRIKLSDLKS